MKFTIYQESRTGKRANNEDRLAHCYSRDSLLLVVADGMGGHYYGEVAAQIAVQTVTEAFQREVRTRIRDPFLFLQKGMLNAHRGILDFAGKHRLADSPRTTCVACIVQNNIAYWAHSGDSRLYLLRKGRVLAQTKDHSRVRLLLEQGVISEDEARDHPDRNKIYGCLGGQQTPEIEFSHKTTLEAEDVLVLCTDGVWSGLPGPILAASLKTGNLMRTVPLLLGQAETRGGPQADNLSMIAVRWQDSYVDESSGSSSLISTKSMSRDTVTTRMAGFGRNPGQKTELSEEEIELAIEEIRSTIQKYSK
ncbi:protein phosphatase 2C domain-containing protein [Accumulibacter sp.]|uniref:PP2C family protein-serine/threonine phosphatase n=1 Tax=Accumulibacter sp. TaxID=2053492 RepID=UPI002631353F|nr:protein phosphatase 2C domain-containing protein [Accumulibacter sp.]HRD92154.1 protein phosphatase 2C domain-containing protein [Accumulibacter sp.]